MRIIVIKIAALGDFLMATPALRALKEHPATSELVLLAGMSIKAVTERCPYPDRIVYLNDKRLYHGSILAKIFEVARALYMLRKDKFQIGFNFHRDWRFNIILKLARVPRRIGFAKHGHTRLLTDTVEIPGIMHHIFHYCRLLHVLNITCLDFHMSFILPDAEIAAAKAKYLTRSSHSAYIALVPGGAANVKEEMPTRRWPSDYFAKLASSLIAQDWQVILLGSRGDEAIATQIADEAAHVLNLCGQTSLAEAAAILQCATLAVCSDSGLMHLAAAVGTRTLAIFGPTHPEEKKPLTFGSRILWAQKKKACIPCYHDGVFPTCNDPQCMLAITPELALKTIQQMLAEKLPRQPNDQV